MTTVESGAYPVSLFDGEDANGVANIVGMLLGQNLENFPSRIKFARKIARPVSIISTDTDSACTIVFGTDEAVVYNDVVGKPAVTVIATVDQILDVSQLPMKAGGLIPVGFFTGRGMTVLGEIVKHKLVVKGLLTHTVTALRTIALVSVIEP
ncbi:hypothetical protein ACVH9Z_39695 [Rhodococcus opacus]|uniref:Uncharacterized protein n=1 Tax=Rhodococcus opacus (strain B4) TaxID=632772 RepID=C1BE15_RHOOB|nr:hypothetical protein [Rhodococcus opacus]MDJ0420204.1 hypothetical protein [Rhodococcus opacus]MDV7090129.1 hypothetical protein [Rhodococcus opacus]UNN04524.1 hypothetical protein MOO23_36350 [Rhodococcus opacus]WKN52667.1 hypothetical protein HJ581_0001795 [Rhodococcus opacus]BAH47218.1 hypothetical protein ROP_pROB02-02110 [Rhodococcus opacus B4]